MRLQLIRYESVELTEQLMRERQGEGDSSESVSQTQCLQSVEESGETVLPVTVDENNKMYTSSEMDLNREESVMRQLQDTAQKLGMEVV